MVGRPVGIDGGSGTMGNTSSALHVLNADCSNNMRNVFENTDFVK